MKYIVIILLIVSCSPQKRIARIIKKNPELTNTEIVTEVDTIKIPEIKEITKLEIVYDSLAYDSLLSRFKTLSSQLAQSPTFETERSIRAEIRRTKEEIRRAVIPDTTFTILVPRRIVVGDTSYTMNSTIDIHLNADGITHTLEVEPFNIPYEKTKIITNIDATRKPSGIWFWLFIIAGIIVAILFIKKESRKH